MGPGQARARLELADEHELGPGQVLATEERDDEHAMFTTPLPDQDPAFTEGAAQGVGTL